MYKKEKQTNMIARWCLVVFTILLGVHILIACAGPEGGASTDENNGSDSSNDDGNQTDNTGAFTITDVKYGLLNVDPNYEPASDTDADVTSGYWLQLDYEGEEPDVENMTITFNFIGTCQWTVNNLTDDNLTGTSGIVVRGLVPSNSDLEYQWSNYILPLGNLEVDVNFGAGIAASFTKTISLSREDGSIDAQYAYSEDVGISQDLPASNVPMIPRAITSNGTYDSVSGIFTCNFTVDDDRVQNGEVWFFDANGEMVAVSKLFVLNGTLNPILNQGNPIDNMGGENTITINSDTEEVDYIEGYAFENISQFSIVLTDGAINSDGLSIINSGCLSFTNKYPFQASIN